MTTAVRGGGSRENGRPQVRATEQDGRSARQARRGAQALALAAVTRSIAVMETVGQAESDLAETLRAMAAQGRGTGAARRLRLAEDAARGAQAAAERSERLQQQARDLAQSLHRLADTGAAKTAPDGAPATDTEAGHALVGSRVLQRLADIDRRLAELRQARPTVPGDGPGLRAGWDAQQRALEARQHWQESVAHLLQARQSAATAFCQAASAHDRAAEANARSARAGIGDVAEHKRMAAFHQAAADADRWRAHNIHDQARDRGAG